MEFQQMAEMHLARIEREGFRSVEEMREFRDAGLRYAEAAASRPPTKSTRTKPQEPPRTLSAAVRKYPDLLPADAQFAARYDEAVSAAHDALTPPASDVAWQDLRELASDERARPWDDERSAAWERDRRRTEHHDLAMTFSQWRGYAEQGIDGPHALYLARAEAAFDEAKNARHRYLDAMRQRKSVEDARNSHEAQQLAAFNSRNRMGSLVVEGRIG